MIYCYQEVKCVKEFIRLATKWKYTWFAWVVNVFYLLMWSGDLSDIPLSVVMIMVCFTVSALLMASGRWWGCIIGIIYGCYVCYKYIYTAYLYYGKIVVTELWLPLLVMLAIAGIHTTMGRMCYMENKKQG